MDFPHAAMRATLAATNFSPAEVPSLYVRPEKSRNNSYRKGNFVQVPRKSEESKSDAGNDQDHRRTFRKSSIRKFGSLFSRDGGLRSSIASSSPLATVVNSECADDEESVETVCSVQPITTASSIETVSPIRPMKLEKIRERREWI